MPMFAAVLPVGAGPQGLQPQIWPVANGVFLHKGTALAGSHRLAHFRGILWCMSCGGRERVSVGARTSRLLKAVCTGVPTNYCYGRAVARLNAGLLPSIFSAWPLGEGAVLDGFV